MLFRSPRAARLLWNPSLQALCGGDAAFIRLASPKETVSLQAGRRFFMGDEILPPELGKLLHRSLLLDAFGCGVCHGEGPRGPDSSEHFTPSREGGWQWGPPRVVRGEE
mgnify:CR=1 FL=1